MRSALFYGSGTALVTPFDRDRVDYNALESLVDWQVEHDADALVILGSTGEPTTVTLSERRHIIECVVSRCAGRVPVIVGTGSNCTRTAIEYAAEAELLGADGLLVVTPYYNKANRDGLFRHYYAIADKVGIPIILYNVPSRTGMCLQPETVAQLARHPMIRGIKEAHADLAHLLRLTSVCGDGFAIYSGNDSATLPMMALGARGVISVAANVIPHDMHEMTMSWIRDDIRRSRELHMRLMPLWDALNVDLNPIPVKAALSALGKIQNELRMPLTPLSDDKTETLRSVMTSLSVYGS